ncbi:plastocyanin/azurin family copper-binding protein [Geodermatophilus sp. YIM 151500]|uniref:plastocyanin/azurin family copper-binding protein n=1 Tax=Geodermatophilus sp. YIM 151500 TaxID=2984531 RepID=UPI0021E3F914|nr:plastocyanin/azurin family copper-binding protein [Geodermatophilus sp. YIM 151500]MCV2491035.1 plastocyanin/azurin family copper-binding protein [Geodermatophilus sp. YIM 151500]
MTAGRLAVRRGVPAAALACALLTACGGGEAAPETAPSAPAGVGTVTTASDGVQEVTLQTQDDYVFTPAEFTVEPGRVRLTVDNVAEELTHNFRFTPDTGPASIAEEIDLLAPGQRETIEFDVTATGDYPFECSFHIRLGQVGTMTVTGG